MLNLAWMDVLGSSLVGELLKIDITCMRYLFAAFCEAWGNENSDTLEELYIVTLSWHWPH